MVAEQEVEEKTFYYTNGIVRFTNLDEAIEFVKLTLRGRP
jgi:hypothetical protein